MISPKMPYRETMLDERGNPDAPPGSHDWAVYVRREIQGGLANAQFDQETLRSLLTAFERYQGYRQLINRQGQPFASYEAFCTTPAPYGLGYALEDIARIIAERKSAAELARTGRPLPKPGGDRKGKGKDQVDNINLKTKGGTSAPYLTARIARDRPDILERMKQGEFRSVRAAAREAGIAPPQPNARWELDQTADVLSVQRYQPRQGDELVKDQARGLLWWRRQGQIIGVTVLHVPAGTPSSNGAGPLASQKGHETL